jgi:hypothetical protein
MKYLRLQRIFFALAAITAGTNYLHATTLSASTTTINLTRTIGQPCTSNGSGITFSATSSLSVDTGSAPFTISPLGVPSISVTPPTSPVSSTTGVNITFSVTSAWTTLNAGLNKTTVTLLSADATNGTSITFNINLLIQEGNATLTVHGGLNTLNPVSYLTGSAAPTLSSTLLSSSGLPVPFTVAVSSTTTPEGASNWLTAGTTSGIVYSFGTTISFTTGTAVTGAAPGDQLADKLLLRQTA